MRRFESSGFQISLLIILIFLSQYGFAAEPDGFAKAVTGGGNALPVRPKTLEELKSALCESFDKKGVCTDTTPGVIVINHIFDFRGSVVTNGSAEATEQGCMANICPKGGGQWGINGVTNFCKKRPATTITYDKAGLKKLRIGSNKTIIGEGKNAGIKGMGLYIGNGAHNVVVRNLTISDINPRVVWGGDALTIDGADGVWIDHNTFARIGRQMIATGWGSAKHVTISNNEFDGRTRYSATCDGHHYYVWLFLGHQDTLTIARNYIHDTSGRAPHSGGMGNADIRAQLVNNVFRNLTYQGAIMSRTNTSHLLAEGNVFENVTHPLYFDTKQPGSAFAIFNPLAPSRDICKKTLGRSCVTNKESSSGTDYRPQDVATLNAFKNYLPYLVSPIPAESAQSMVPRDAGAGHINPGHA